MDEISQLTIALADRYAISREIGRGGMATVYLARDLRHDRDVALKLFKPELGAILGPERFLSEIRVMAKLQHPNLLPLFDSGECAGQLYYVMPFVEGESLRARLSRERQLSVHEATRIAAAVASALDYAHRHGIIHRDLKPENILLHDGQPLIADFGIALAVSNSGGERLTQTGLSLGTPLYMSPEQATGERAIDGRTDIYSLGAVLYEMLAGEPPHVAPTVQAIVARVLTDVPRRLRMTRASVPDHIDAAVAKALEKVPADRFETAADFADVLQGQKTITGATASLAPMGEQRRPRPLAGVAVGIVGLIVGLGGALVFPRLRRPVDAMSVSFVLTPSAGEEINGPSVDISPDGRRIVYAAAIGDVSRLYLRPLDDAKARVLSGTDGAQSPVFSPDGKWIAFFAGDKLKRIAIDDGSIVTVARGLNPRPIAWVDPSRILIPTRAITQRRSGLSEISPNGGDPTPVIASDTAHGENFEEALALPDLKTILFQSQGPGGPEDDFLAVGSLVTHDRTTTSLLISRPLAYVDGFVIGLQLEPGAGAIIAVPFDLRARRVLGDPVTLLEGARAVHGAVLSPTGTLAYTTGESYTDLVSADAGGKAEVLLSGQQTHTAPRLSPDGKHIAFLVRGAPNQNVWIFDIATKTMSKLTSEGASAPEWTPDSKRIIYVRPTTIGQGIWIQPIDASAPAEQLRPRLPSGSSPPSEAIVAPDNTTVFFVASVGSQRQNLYYFSPATDGDSIHTWLATPYDETDPRFSPDGKWIAYTSNESGQPEVYIKPFIGSGPRIPVSSGGGDKPLWSTDGHTLYYRTGSTIMSVTVTTAPVPTVSNRRMAFTTNSVPAAPGSMPFDISRDGKRVVFARASGGDSRVVVVTNWLGEIRAKLRAAPK